MVKMKNTIILTESQTENIINEFKESDIKIDQYEAKDELNPKFWIDNKLNSRIRLKLLDIADDFIKELNIKWVKPNDIVLTGSIANYNWTKHSDVDIHIMIDYTKVYKNKDFVKTYFDAKKELWLSQHENLKIYGFPVEIYVEDSNADIISSGIYSLEKNEWVQEPKDLTNAKINADYVKKTASNFINQIEDLDEKIKKEKDVKKIEILTNKMEKIYTKLKNLRKDGLKSKSKEMSSGNIIWKICRTEGYIKKIWDTINYNYDKSNSITESIINEAFQKNGRLKNELSKLDKIGTFRARIDFCKLLFGDPIGRGSSRLVFQINDELVLKLALNEKGIAQNYQEYSVCSDQYLSDIFTRNCKKYPSGKHENWIISEYVLPAKKNDFIEVLGIDFVDYCDLLFDKFVMRDRIYKYYYFDDYLLDLIENSEGKTKDILKKIYRNKKLLSFLCQVNDYITDYDSGIGDLRRISSYGLTKRNGVPKIVILDSGLNNDIYDTYYNRNNVRIRESITKTQLDKEANKANKHPSYAQIEGGNYKMGHVRVLGFDISIENPKGSYRYWKTDDGKSGKSLLKNHYGYFNRTDGYDGDQIDVFLGDDLDSDKIYVIDQYVNGKFDESKVMLCFSTETKAKNAYKNNYEKGWNGLHDITCVDIPTFKKWLYDGYKQRKPFCEYKDIKRLVESKEDEKYKKDHGIKEISCGFGFSEKEQKYYGWSHRAIYGFGVGSKVKKGDCGFDGKNKKKAGFENKQWVAKNLEDAKKMALDFKDAVD